MILDELQIFQLRPLHEQFPCRVSVALSGAGCFSEKCILAACSDYHRVGVHRVQPAGCFIKQKDPIANAVPDQSRMKTTPQSAPDQPLRLMAANLHHQSGYNLLARGSTAITGPFIRLTAECPAQQTALTVHRKHGSDSFQLTQNLPGVFTKAGDSLHASQTASACQRILNVTFHRIPAAVLRQNGVNAPRRHHGLGSLGRERGDQCHVNPFLRAAYGTGHTGYSAADDHNMLHTVPLPGRNMLSSVLITITVAAAKAAAQRI